MIPKEDSADMQEWQNRVQQDISELKSGHTHLRNEQTTMRDDIRNLQFNDKLQDQEIKTLKETLGEIKSDTQWIRRKITGAIISAVSTAIIGGIIGIIIYNIF